MSLSVSVSSVAYQGLGVGFQLNLNYNPCKIKFQLSLSCLSLCPVSVCLSVSLPAPHLFVSVLCFCFCPSLSVCLSPSLRHILSPSLPSRNTVSIALVDHAFTLLCKPPILSRLDLLSSTGQHPLALLDNTNTIRSNRIEKKRGGKTEWVKEKRGLLVPLSRVFAKPTDLRLGGPFWWVVLIGC